SISLNESGIATNQAIPSDFLGRIPKAERSIIFNDHGMFFVRDTITYHNDGMEPIHKFFWCMNFSEARGLYDMSVTTISGVRLQANKKPYSANGFATWGILLQAPLMPGESIQFVNQQYFDGNMAFSMNETALTVYFEFSLHPVMPYEMDVVTTKMRLTNNARINNIEPTVGSTTGGVTTFTSERVAPFTFAPLNVLFNNPEGKIVETERAIITVMASSHHDWLVKSDMIIANLGLLDLTSLKFTIPEDAYQVTAYDSFGKILGVKLEAPARSGMNLTLNLLANRYKITTGNKFQFTLEYKIPGSSRMRVGDERNIIRVALDKFCTMQWITRDLSVKF
nr:hypothetical protein [Candidatus Sigynarchaeota archaeon]